MISYRTLINLAAIALSGIYVVSSQLPKLRQQTNNDPRAAAELAVKQEQARLAAIARLPQSGFGFNNLIANWAFLSFLQYFGDDQARGTHGTGYGLSAAYFDQIIRRDPRFLSSYIYLSSSVSIFAGQPQKSVDLIKYGSQFLQPELQPLAYTVWRFKGIDQLLFLGDTAAARQSFLTAAEWAERATFRGDELPGIENAAARSRETAAFLATNPDSRSARINGWALVLSSAADQKTRAVAIAELDKLGIRVEFNQDGNFSLKSKS
ncbi:MAG: hypothetical protein SFT94_03950 [Pseudanabaenaceae cyanobacterium bins.68]|nr:hypothetical protein [Pseudanabaenaceae cyanobacterium bins.68]